MAASCQQLLPSFPPADSCKCSHLQGRQKCVLGLLASTDCLNCSSLSSWGKRTWAKEIGDVGLWEKVPLTTLFNGNKIPSVPAQNSNQTKIVSSTGTIPITAPLQGAENEKELQIKRRIKHMHLLSPRLHP